MHIDFLNMMETQSISSVHMLDKIEFTFTVMYLSKHIYYQFHSLNTQVVLEF